jgi:5-(carboxyamino)imidazole ribonucleotide synthase
MVLKARFGGYDGKGTRYAHNGDQFESHRELWGAGGWMAEEFVDFSRELAVMVVRTQADSFCLPTVETVQTKHVCDLVYPAWRDASEIALAAVEAMGGYGLFGVELFERTDGALMVNEIAPRPHNTGHYTLDWGAQSQFDLHARLAANLPVSAPKSPVQSVMANLLGQDGAGDFRSGLRAALGDPGVRFHWYGKAKAAPGRKMGHLNVVGPLDAPTTALIQRAIDARDAFYEAWTRQ